MTEVRSWTAGLDCGGAGDLIYLKCFIIGRGAVATGNFSFAFGELVPLVRDSVPAPFAHYVRELIPLKRDSVLCYFDFVELGVEKLHN